MLSDPPPALIPLPAPQLLRFPCDPLRPPVLRREESGAEPRRFAPPAGTGRRVPGPDLPPVDGIRLERAPRVGNLRSVARLHFAAVPYRAAISRQLLRDFGHQYAIRGLNHTSAVGLQNPGQPWARNAYPRRVRGVLALEGNRPKPFTCWHDAWNHHHGHTENSLWLRTKPATDKSWERLRENPPRRAAPCGLPKRAPIGSLHLPGQPRHRAQDPLVRSRDQRAAAAPTTSSRHSRLSDTKW